MIICCSGISLSRLILCLFIYGLFTGQAAYAQNQRNEILPVKMIYSFAGKDSGFTAAALSLTSSFSAQSEAEKYIRQIPQMLAAKGYPLASVDSSWQRSDSFFVQLYIGTLYKWIRLNTDSVPANILTAVGYRKANFENKPLEFSRLQNLQSNLVKYFENNGYPFAEIKLDSVQLMGEAMYARLQIKNGVLYHVDSIRLIGKASLSKIFLQRYLDIQNGSVYNRSKLEAVDRRILELPFLAPVQPSDLTMLGAGSVLNVYANAKKSSQVNFLVGFLPSSTETNKLRLTADVNLDLKNSFGSAEEILVKWQQLQPKSPRLNLGFSRPYLFNSPFGISTLFDLFKKDSNFLQVNAQAGLQYNLSASQSGKLFLQWQSNTLLGGAVDTNQVKLLKRLPANVDVSAANVGIDYTLHTTNYRLNPSKGSEIFLSTSVGIKKIKRNNDIINIKDASFDYNSLYDSVKPRSYQLRVRTMLAHYFPVGKESTFKTALSGGIYNSPNIFRNELFQIGGYKLLRGFDEESVYATSYAVLTAEYRYLVGLHSYLFGFSDLGLVNNKYQELRSKNVFTSIGLGLVFETKAGLLNVSYAIGKRDDLKFNIREASKLHFGYINYF